MSRALEPVLVTGASRGIGLAIAERLVAAERRVIGVARDEAALAEVRARLGERFVPLAVDLGDPGARAVAIASAIERVGLPGALVSSAGNAEYVAALELDEAGLERHLALHLVAGFTLARDLARAWIAAGREGSIVAVSSTLAQRPAPYTLAYAVAKAGLEAMVRGLALELAPHRIRVNAVAGGVVDTAMTRGARPDAKDAEARFAELASLHPLGRLGRADELASTVVHALDAAWMTGSVLTLDGGLSLV